MYDIAAWETNDYNTHAAQHLKKCKQSENEF